MKKPKRMAIRCILWWLKIQAFGGGKNWKDKASPRHFHSAEVNKVPFWDRAIGALGLARIRGFQVGEILCSMHPTCKHFDPKPKLPW